MTQSSPTRQKPICFVVRPYGDRDDPKTGERINFDEVYERGIVPAIEHAGLLPTRSDVERGGGIVHKAMYERLILSEFVVADLTTANPNVFYELGVRHAVRPHTTVAILAKAQPLPFNVNHLQCIPYDLGDAGFSAREAQLLRERLGARLIELREGLPQGAPFDSPLFHLVSGYVAPSTASLKTDVFRDRVAYSESVKKALTRARRSRDKARVQAVRAELGDLSIVETGVLVDLLLSFRAVEAWQEMIDLSDALPAEVKRTVLVREQTAFAFNRLGRPDDARDLLESVLAEQGPSSETYGLLGRVYKDLWQRAKRDGGAEAEGHLTRAIEHYQRGFEADWRDPYPGINAVTLLDVRAARGDRARQREILPVVRYAALRRLRDGTPGYWDHATLLELEVLADREKPAREHLADALASVRERWEPTTTANNLTMIRESRAGRAESVAWLDDIIDALVKAGAA